MKYDFRQEIVVILEEQFNLHALGGVCHVAQGHGGEIIEGDAVGRGSLRAVQQLRQVFTHLIFAVAETVEIVAEYITDPDAPRSFDPVIQDGEAQDFRVFPVLTAAEDRLISVSVAAQQPGAAI